LYSNTPRFAYRDERSFVVRIITVVIGQTDRSAFTLSRGHDHTQVYAPISCFSNAASTRGAQRRVTTRRKVSLCNGSGYHHRTTAQTVECRGHNPGCGDRKWRASCSDRRAANHFGINQTS